MGQEIELKLCIDPGDIDALGRHPLIGLYADGPPIEKHLINHYFDTPEQQLRSSAMALRIRFDGRSYIQTLKQKGRSRDGLTVRGEWEWPVDGPSIRTELLPLDILPREAREGMDRLAPVFRTDFHRTLWTLRIPPENRFHLAGPAVVEMVLDRGAVISGGEAPILEVELELLEGASGILHQLSDLLAASIRVTPCDISKAQRGYRLLGRT